MTVTITRTDGVVVATGVTLTEAMAVVESGLKADRKARFIFSLRWSA